ncbi:MAG: hypothetical protein PHQ66_00865 [Candidatus Nanoarchaeia archaeon]|nr:hypothetical protein [Candidatus Nanoarchaeia archaeon]MDD5358471.1 hypothetical protein [Candidatus Nanoarchaeia archaeon]MDD5588985.1 hypothetical protein [Candidatus Nanoarchaeia archaeon]
MDITPYLTAIMAVIGIAVGTLVSPKINQRINMEHNRKDLIFKKKLEYFEKIAETIEENRRMYHQIIGRIECSKNNKETNEIIAELKQARKNFLIKSSPLYFDTRSLSEKIVNFVRIEKEIFSELEKIKESEREKIIGQLKENMKKLNMKANEIICEMKKELSR